MSHVQCLVSCSCRKSPAKKVIQGHSGQISSKTINGPQFFFVVATKNPFMEDLLGSSLRTTARPKLLKILPRGANLFQRNAAPVSAPESAECFTFRRNFLFWTRLRPIRKGSQTAWQAIRLDFIDNKNKMIAKDYELHCRCEFLC